MLCDTTVDSSDETESVCDISDDKGETTEEDKKFMNEAKECSRKSPDTETKVK